MKNEDLKVIRASIKNFQNIEEKEVVLNGKSILVIGKNGSGKSALVRVLKSASSITDLPSKSIKEGEETAKIEVEYGNENEGFIYEVWFSEENQKGRLTVKDREGNPIVGVSAQKSLLGDFTFDPFEFVNLGRTASGKVSTQGVREQIEILKGFLSDQERLDLSKLENEYNDKYETRTFINRELKNLESEATSADLKQEDIVKYENNKKDRENELISKLEKVSKASSDHTRIESEVKMARERLATIQAEAELLKDKIDKGSEWLSKNSVISVDDINKELSDVREHNRMYDLIKGKLNVVKTVREKRTVSGDLSNRLDAIKIEKSKIVSSGALPIKGLSFSETEILFNDLPFDFDHHPKSTIIAIGIQIAIAKNPRLKTIFIDDGSLLDEKTLKWLFKKCDDEGFQLIIEMVDYKSSDLHVEFIEKFLEK